MKNLFMLCSFVTFFTFILAQAPTKQRFSVSPGGISNFNSVEDGPWYVNIQNSEAGQYLDNQEMDYMRQLKSNTQVAFSQKKGFLEITDRSLQDPIINQSFIANAASGSVPMDNYVAVSDTGLITSVSNTIIQVYNEDGILKKSRTLASFCSVLGLAGVSNMKYDPKVIYDPDADRFIAVILNGINSTYSKIIVAFSETNRPDSTWNFYALPGNPFGDTTWFDYPAISITDQEVFITGNQLKDGMSWLLGFKQSIIWQINKSDGYYGDTLDTYLWSNINSGGRPIRNLHPVKGGQDIYGPKQYFLSNRNISTLNDTIFLLNINDTIDAPGAQLQVDILQSDIPYGFPPNGYQKLAGQYLATNDGRVLGGFYEDGRIYFASNSVDTANGRAAIYFAEIMGVDNQTYNITGNIISNDTLDFGYPNLSWCGFNGIASDLFLSFLHTGSNRYPGISTMFYSNDQFSNIKTVKEGLSTLNLLSDSIERWGDYFGSQPKYNNNGAVWICGTFGNTTNAYRAFIAELYSPLGVGIEENENQINSSNQANIVYPNPTIDFTNLEIELSADLNAQMYLFDIQGRPIATLFNGNLYKGKNKIQFNIGHLSKGSYILHLTADGKSILNKIIIKD